MDLPTILVKIVGAVFLLWTGRSIWRHVKDKRLQQVNAAVASQSITELILNNILLYLWYAFMLVFSTGMIVNN
jgi:threonine/homoserine/homoserine lactone efflux protein